MRDGFVELSAVFAFAQPLGFSLDAISSSLRSASEGRLIEYAGLDRVQNADGRAVRITPCGAYMAGTLVRTFSYIDIIVDDLPVLDKDLAGALRPMRHSRDTIGRLNRAERVVEYLSESWTPLDGLTGLPVEWPVVAGGIRRDIARVRGSVEKRRR